MRDLKVEFMKGKWLIEKESNLKFSLFEINIYDSVKNNCCMGSVLAICNDEKTITGKSKLMEIAPVGLFSDQIEKYRLRIGKLNMSIKYLSSEEPLYIELVLEDETLCFKKVA
jgi:hypothetical protein